MSTTSLCTFILGLDSRVPAAFAFARIRCTAFITSDSHLGDASAPKSPSAASAPESSPESGADATIRSPVVG